MRPAQRLDQTEWAVKVVDTPIEASIGERFSAVRDLVDDDPISRQRLLPGSAFQDIAESGIRINGGYFVLERRVFDYLEEGEDLPEMFHRLIARRRARRLRLRRFLGADGHPEGQGTARDAGRERRQRLAGLGACGRGRLTRPC